VTEVLELARAHVVAAGVADAAAHNGEGSAYELSALHLAASIGRCNAATALLTVPEYRKILVNRSNNSESSGSSKRNSRSERNSSGSSGPLECASLRGHWKMTQLLLDAGADLPASQADRLITRVLAARFYSTAGCMVAAGLGSITIDILRERGAVPAET
jgi:hypothetical protein